jgi:opacity protein-like surface antigen
MARVVWKRRSESGSVGFAGVSMGVALLWSALFAAPMSAQRQDHLVFEVFGGAATYGRFVEQLASEGIGTLRERELRGGTGPTFGGSLGYTTSVLGVEDVTGQLGFQWGSSDYEFELDDPRVTGDFDEPEAGAFVTYIVSASITKFLGDTDGSLAPYAVVGLNGTWWSLDQDEPVTGDFGQVQPTRDGDGTIFRFGGTAGFGLQIAAEDEFAIRLEYMRHSVRNPFNGDGDDAFNITTGTKTDEPDRVPITRYSLGLLYFLEL